ncbi:MAG: FAD-dependent oxidoreductase [Hyphomicrobium sp.]
MGDSGVRIAVVGAGIAGLSAAWLLSRRYDVVLFEKDERVGGHANTVDVREAGGNVAIDTGFIVYNTACYPNLIALFAQLDVPVAETGMSFSVSIDGGRYEYNGNGVNGYFGQRSNLVSPRHWRMAAEISRFFAEASKLSAGADDPHLTLGQWLQERHYSPTFIERHILPMGAAIWSAPAHSIEDFPAHSFARFFANHGLLQMRDRPQWRTVRGGSREYVSRLVSQFKGRVAMGDGAQSISRHGEGVSIRTVSGQTAVFDRCLMACHADTALQLLSDASEHEQRLLGAFQYTRNAAVLHTDSRLMPRRRRVWASWNYAGLTEPGNDRGASVSYWMNKLQPLATEHNYFVSLNQKAGIEPDKIIATFAYDHPVFDTAALRAQKDLWSLQGQSKTWFAGSYFGFGFHEDGLQSGLAAAEELGDVRRPWRVEGENGRLTFGDRGVPSLQAAAQ